MPTERLADRTHLGPDHRAPDDVPLDGIDEDLAVELLDLDRLPPTVAPTVVEQLGDLAVVTPTLRPGLL